MPSRWDEDSTPLAPPSRDPADPGLDPYVRWAVHTAWRGFARQAGWQGGDDPNGRVRIIARARDAADIQALADTGLATFDLDIPPAYLQPLPGTDYQCRCFTASLLREGLEQWLVQNPLGLRWRLALSMRDSVRDARPSSKGLYGPDRDAAVLGASNLLRAAFEPIDRFPGASGLPGAIALIDHGCPFANAQFGRGATTRMAALWDQGADARPLKKDVGRWPWQKPAGMGYGRELGPRAFGAIAGALSQPQPLDEMLVYRSLDYLIDEDDPRRRIWFATHGGHLLDVAGGSPDPLAAFADAAGADLAAQAPLIFVQLPMPAALDSSGASLAAHLLDGARYALACCSPGAPLSLSISFGGYGGPHDGSSLIELALDELVDNARGNLAIVLAAGNAREAGCHARRVVRRNRSALLRVAVPADDTTDSFVELWYDAPGAGCRLELRVRPPNRDWSRWVRPDDETLQRDDGVTGDVTAFLRHDARVPNGHRRMGLLALAPTAQPDDMPCALATPGEWQLEARLVGSDGQRSSVPAALEVVLDAWIERDDAGRRPGTARLRFVDQESWDDRGTLSSIATGSKTFVVAGMNIDTGETPTYSSLGLPGGRQPDLRAACEESAAMPSIRAAATRSGETVRLNGTSVAAPVLSRRLYNLMAARSAAGKAPLQTGQGAVREKLIEGAIQSAPRLLARDD